MVDDALGSTPSSGDRDDVTPEVDLEAVILGGDRHLDAAAVAQLAGVSVQDARRLWRALGFPDAVEGQATFTAADATALHDVAAAGAKAGLDISVMTAMTRAVGQQLNRLSEWEVALLLPQVENREDPVAASTQLLNTLSEPFERLLIYAWRRHLAAAVVRKQMLVGGEEQVQVPSATVGFADLVGFSTVTNSLKEDQIGELVEVFETRAQDVVVSRGGRVIKTLGDSVLFLAPEAVEAVDTGLDIVGVIGGDKRLPDVRVGLATGPVVLRMGDVYGPAVNLAARLMSAARRNRVIIDAATAELLPLKDFDVRRLPSRPLRGFGETEPIVVRRTRSRHHF